MATTTMQRQRTATPERWLAALARVFVQGVQVRQLQCGVWVASSGTDATGAYAVTLVDCECRAAAEGDPVCKHRAALAHALGYLDTDPEPEPLTPAAAPAAILRAQHGGTQLRCERGRAAGVHPHRSGAGHAEGIACGHRHGRGRGAVGRAGGQD